MPVTAKLSREFYDRFGDKVVDELVGLLNDMDAAFRADLREINERNFQRFEAKLEQRISELGAELRSDMAAMGSGLRAEMAGLRTGMEGLKAELIKWMFLFWLGTVATMLGFGRLLLTS
jgi:ABC-type phosphate transport system auxiliary subunit